MSIEYINVFHFLFTLSLSLPPIRFAVFCVQIFCLHIQQNWSKSAIVSLSMAKDKRCKAVNFRNSLRMHAHTTVKLRKLCHDIVIFFSPFRLVDENECMFFLAPSAHSIERVSIQYLINFNLLIKFVISFIVMLYIIFFNRYNEIVAVCWSKIDGSQCIKSSVVFFFHIEAYLSLRYCHSEINVTLIHFKCSFMLEFSSLIPWLSL